MARVRTMCNLPRNEYRRRQVYGHVSAQRCYQSRKTRAIRNTPYRKNKQDKYQRQLPQNLPHMTQFALNTGLIKHCQIQEGKRDEGVRNSEPGKSTIPVTPRRKRTRNHRNLRNILPILPIYLL